MKVIDMLNVLVNEQTTFSYIKYYDRRNKKYEIMLNCEENIINKLDQGNITLYDEIEGIVEHEEEPQEHKIPDKIDQWDRKWHYTYYKKEQLNQIQDNIEQLRQKYNKIIDYLEEIK